MARLPKEEKSSNGSAYVHTHYSLAGCGKIDSQRVFLSVFHLSCAVERFVYPASSLHRENSHLTKARIAATDLGIPTMDIKVDPFLTPKGRPDPPWLAFDKGWEVRVVSPSATEISIEEMKALKQKVVPGNPSSLVILFRFLNGTKSFGRVLLPGDATPETLEIARDTGRYFPELEIDNDMFLIPHHGSHRNLPLWVEPHVQGIAAISAPTNAPKHPSAQTLKVLSAWVCNPKPSNRHFGFVFADGVSADEWGLACRIFQKRHLLAHKMGDVDAEYIQKANDPNAILGRKIRLDSQRGRKWEASW